MADNVVGLTLPLHNFMTTKVTDEQMTIYSQINKRFIEFLLKISWRIMLVISNLYRLHGYFEQNLAVPSFMQHDRGHDANGANFSEPYYSEIKR